MKVNLPRMRYLSIFILKIAYVNGVNANPVKCVGNFAELFAQAAVLFAHVYAALKVGKKGEGSGVLL